ncbi:hypothetical protein LRS11_15790 [Pseudomonas sp. J452]|uniref:hypothetical protein n=1 Tax=Pseudomonas sp. J452 TaxID=2898441 RepID=UPI0021AD8907|nr:hypothetical protein [Pseudomonas sp. J452]UUY07280.1 hypothetical protein LRS11_15790 [Pseudomonas sp. J452]
MLLRHLMRAQAAQARLRAPYRTLVFVLGWVMVLTGCVLVAVTMYYTRIALGLPLSEAPLAGMRLAFFCWLAITLLSVPVLFIASLFVVRGLFSLLLLTIGKCSPAQAYWYAIQGRPPASWLKPEA